MVARRRRRSTADLLGALLVGGLAVLAAALGGGYAYDALHREAVRPKVLESWPHARAVLEARLHQGAPLELGAVWATHSGVICGLVNGKGSFSGLAGMTPFAVEGDHAVFALDQSALVFAPYWRDCTTDQWITILDGSMQAGGCATKLGQARCVTVTGG
jgi:hypothetical protein